MSKLDPHRLKSVALAAAALALIGGTVFVFATRTGSGTRASKVSGSGQAVPDKPSNPPTEDGYQGAVKAALADFLAVRAELPADLGTDRGERELSVVRTAKAALAGVVVTADRRKSHLDLVLSLVRIEQGIGDKDAKLWKSGEDGLDAFVKDNMWLGDSASSQ